ncbi:hypothetical protein [Mycolicibacter hiberniae]|uniref:Uncharacterized protein n=1 Tax=Mycolicibacter hiberniae TaxID=29314 RepID=A0A7I7X608_9MYCO|nr:hypothetical protein [Mycolicibacter hiberniae]MCV7087587.1 hypothetical protein [Mycolicibacter hiberniae]ORV72323.1 hypothetical protein AWC09_04970 [Mycolicibacter hiberniae]BBZ24892.1 hypothetical protein MHIB_33100 [Mycolicibacter hiberniae]
MVQARRWWAPCYALGLTLLILAPLLRPGYLLLRDAVSTPRSYLTGAALGLSESAPRAIPQDFAVALASRLADGGIVVKALLVVGLWLAGWGAARLVAIVLPEAGLPGQLIAVTVAIWNPYVAERLLQGHWSLLVGYGCLPWAAVAMLGLRSGATGLFGLVFFLALAGLTPTGLVLATVVALVCVAAPGDGPPRWWCALSAMAIATAAALPWLTALVLSPGSAHGESAGAAAFAARAEPGLGTLGSLAGLGGIWNSEAVPASRTTFALLATVVFLAVLGLGWSSVRDLPAVRPLLALAATTVLAFALLATGPGVALLRWATDIAPGLGMLRDGQKWVALAVPGYALAGAGAVVGLRKRLPPARAALACCVALIVVLPDLAWGVAGRVTPVHYPPGWAAVAAKINADPRPVAVLPADAIRRFPWAGTAPVLDPLPRWVRAEVLTTGDLMVGGQTVPGEGTRARTVQEALLSGAEPAALGVKGVGWVVRETDAQGEIGAAEKTLTRLPVAYRDADLTVYRVGGHAPKVPTGPRRAAIAAHLVWLAMLVAGAAGLAAAPLRRRLRG